MTIKQLSNRKVIVFFLVIILLAFLAEKATGEQPRNRDYWPTRGWRTSTPELQGMDSTKLLIADEFIRDRLPDAFSLLVVKTAIWFLRSTIRGEALKNTPWFIRSPKVLPQP